MARNPVILLEFNELCPELMYRFMAEDQLPNFARFYGQSQIYLTDAGEKAPNLEPWIQWVTVHSGMPFSDHKIFDLGDGHLLKQSCIWDVLSRANRKVWVCGSMNARYDLPLNGYLLPDPWSSGTPHYPDSLAPYLNFVRASVQEHTNERASFSRSDALKFLAFMLAHGLSASTTTAIARQLLSEKNSRNRWKRSMILDRLQFDVFRHFYRKFKPDFSTFFLNSTAHLQHMYWRNMEPSLFKIQPTETEQANFAAAILFGYKQMDDLVGKFLRLVDPSTTLIFSTALSQQPCLIYEEAGGKTLYRPRDFGRLLSFAGVNTESTVAPVMAEQFHVHFPTEEDAAEGERQLNALQVDDRAALFVKRQGGCVLSGCGINHDLPPAATLVNANGNTAPFFEIFYQIEGIKSGMHHADGMLWISTPERLHKIYSEKIPLTSIAPTILNMLHVEGPAHMRGPTVEEWTENVRARVAVV